MSADERQYLASQLPEAVLVRQVEHHVVVDDRQVLDKEAAADVEQPLDVEEPCGLRHVLDILRVDGDVAVIEILHHHREASRTDPVQDDLSLFLLSHVVAEHRREVVARLRQDVAMGTERLLLNLENVHKGTTHWMVYLAHH